MQVTVEAYAGYKADERPQRFTLQGRSFDVQEIVDRWYGPDYAYFKVRAGDGNIYLLKHSPQEDAWSLEVFRQAGRE